MLYVFLDFFTHLSMRKQRVLCAYISSLQACYITREQLSGKNLNSPSFYEVSYEGLSIHDCGKGLWDFQVLLFFNNLCLYRERNKSYFSWIIVWLCLFFFQLVWLIIQSYFQVPWLCITLQQNNFYLKVFYFSQYLEENFAFVFMRKQYVLFLKSDNLLQIIEKIRHLFCLFVCSPNYQVRLKAMKIWQPAYYRVRTMYCLFLLVFDFPFRKFKLRTCLFKEKKKVVWTCTWNQ